jgi:anti-sigma regulatory factor (Ser/Thr protein kinase)
MEADSPRFWVRLVATPESVPLVRQTLRAYLDELSVSEEQCQEIALAVTEACANAVVHGYPDAPGDLEVCAAEEGGDLVIVVRDAGVGMGPRIDSPGLGVGLPVIATLADSVEIDKSPAGGTDVRMRFVHVTPDGLDREG